MNLLRINILNSYMYRAPFVAIYKKVLFRKIRYKDNQANIQL
jgi:hypothetical protein